MPAASFAEDHGHVHLPNPVARYGDDYKDAIYEDFPPYGPPFSDYPVTASRGFAPAYPGPIDHFSQPVMSTMYTHSAPFPVDDYYPDHPCLHPMGAPMIPPLRIEERVVHQPSHQPHKYTQAQGYATLPEPTYPKEEKPTGGVSAKLDYDVDQMTDFVAETTVTVIRTGHPVSPAFRKWVLQVLNATRLPSATILLSLSYLAIRVRQESTAGTFQPSERTFYKMITVAMILGSKFLDDNTFQNKSWAEVTNLPVMELNQDEREWLAAFDHRLHHDPSRVDGFNVAQKQWKAFQAHVKARHQAAPPLQAIDTNLRSHHSIQSLSTDLYVPYVGKTEPRNYASESALINQSYNTPSGSQYDPWPSGYRSMERSPLSTASHSGPHTPEYMSGAAHGWGSSQHSRASQYGYPTMPSCAPQSSAGPEYRLPGYRRHCAWTTHGHYCQCQVCRHQNPMMTRCHPTVMA